jgi:hypothetical protein
MLQHGSQHVFSSSDVGRLVASLRIYTLTQLDPLASSQFTQAIFNNPPPAESEDCLYLNVYAPATPAGGSGRAVLFWIYGGSLQFGTAGKTTWILRMHYVATSDPNLTMFRHTILRRQLFRSL